MTEINHPVEIPRRPAIRLNDLRNQCNDLPPPDGFRPFKNRIVCESEATIASPELNSNPLNMAWLAKRLRQQPTIPKSTLWAGSRKCKVSTAVKDKNRSEEHTSELQSLLRISYAVFCLQKKK